MPMPTRKHKPIQQRKIKMKTKKEKIDLNSVVCAQRFDDATSNVRVFEM